jgi:hypothetical protein
MTCRLAARARDGSGQATLETVAVLPLLIAVALAVGHVLAAGMTHELAGHAAQAGAIAVIRGGDAKASVRAALPEWARDEVDVRVVDRRVRVRLEPPAVLPAVADALAATGTADAGPAAAETAAAGPASTATATAAAGRVVSRNLDPPSR